MRILLLIFLYFPILLISQVNMNLNLLGTYDYDFPVEGNDIWGWVDEHNNEYALVGLTHGLSVVNVTNPLSPVEEFFISDIYSIWRDIKTWGNYAYVTTEANAGLLIVDLTDMTGSTYSHVTQFTNNNGGSVSFTSAHDIYIDEYGIAYIFGAGGSGPQSNGAIFLDVNANPTNPVYLGEWSDEYIHDGMVRGDTMYAGCIYAGELFIVDVSDKSNPVTIGSHPTPNNFTHNVWVSDDSDYVFTTDEVSNAYLAAYDISDLGNIQEIDRIQSNPGSNSIPHNTFVDGNFLITSYYRDGTTVHDITHPSYMIQVGYYDSYSGSGNGFDGCWGTYPFLPSGNIISSDINSGPGGGGRLLIYERDFQQACYLKGNVTDAGTGGPISNTSIEILSTTINESTNLLGFYQTASVNSGNFEVIFSATGYNTDTLTVSLVNGVMTVLNVTLCPLSSSTSNTTTNFACGAYTWSVDGNTYTASGTYTDVVGCHTEILNLTINSSTTSTTDVIECDTYTWNGIVYTTSGTYTYTTSNTNNCDSTATLNLTVNPSTTSTTNITACDTYTWNGTVYTTSGTYTDVSINSAGCTETEILELTIISSTSNTITVTECDEYLWPIDGNLYTSSGTYTDVSINSAGCTETEILELTIISSTSNTTTVTECDEYLWPIDGNLYTSSGTYTYLSTNAAGCPEIETINLTITNGGGCIDSLATNYDMSAVCDNGSCIYNLFISEYSEGSSYNKYIEIYNSSAVTVDLSTYEIWKITNGGSWFEHNLTLSGTLAAGDVYVIASSSANLDPIISAAADTIWSQCNFNGDDAVGIAKNGILIDLVGTEGPDPGSGWVVAGVSNATQNYTLIRKCSISEGDTIWSQAAGIDSLSSEWLVYPQDYWNDIGQHSICQLIYGCIDSLACNYDSLATISDSSCVYDATWQQAEVICNGDSIIVGLSTYFLSGTYIDTLNTIYGCDSIVYTSLTVTSALEFQQGAVLCEGDSLIVGSSVYYTAGNYSDTLTAIAGCDSIVYTTLTVTSPLGFQQSVVLCEGDSLIVGSSVYYIAGNYSDTLTAIAGCDSIIWSNLSFYSQTPLIIQSEPNPAEICLGDTIALEASAGFSQYAWYSGTLQVGQTHILFDTPNDNQWYMVVAVDTNGCESIEDINVYVDSCVTGFDNINNENMLLIYPNPASNQVTVKIMVKAKGVRVYNMLGELVVDKSVMQGEDLLQLDVKEWRTAIYNIHLYNEERIIVNKILNVVR